MFCNGTDMSALHHGTLREKSNIDIVRRPGVMPFDTVGHDVDLLDHPLNRIAAFDEESVRCKSEHVIPAWTVSSAINRMVDVRGRTTVEPPVKTHGLREVARNLLD